MTTLTTYLDRYFTQRRRRGELDETTARKQRRKMAGLDESFGNRPLSHFGAKAIDRWRNDLGHLAPSSRRHYVSVARGFGRWMLAEGLISTDPTAHLAPIHQPRRAPVTFTRDEVRLILAATKDDRTLAMAWLLVGCGCRCIEVSRLRVEDYDPQGRTVHLIGKAGNERVTPVPAKVARALDRYLDGEGRVGGPLFRSAKRPEPLLSSSVSRLVTEAIKAAGVKSRPLDGRTPHGLRRTAGSDIMEVTGDIVAVQEILGHASVETTARFYLRRRSLQQLREAMEGRTYDEAA